MNGKMTRLGIVVLSMFALAIGSSVCYSIAQTAEDCENLEESASIAGDRLRECKANGDCASAQGGVDYWDCAIEECWNDVDQVCADTGCTCILQGL